MKRKTALFFAMLFCCVTLSGCDSTEAEAEDKLQVVCTIFSAYDWTRQIVGEENEAVEVTLLANDGTDLHSYQPSVEDIAIMKQADVLIYVGGTSDTWVSDVLEDGMQTVVLLEAADAQEEVVVDGMQEEEEEAEEDGEIDEHVWLSLRQAVQICTVIQETLCTVDAEHATQYVENGTAYVQQLENLDTAYETMVEDATRNCILVADRFPFRYLAEDYDLTYYAAFPGCSAETEASFETIAFLATKVVELELPYILVTESSDQSIAQTVLENADTEGEILVLDSLQSVTQEELDSGITYLSRMEENLEALRMALNASME